jgi:hypothetical protein
MRNGMWVFGVGSFADLIRKAGDYTLDGVAHPITAPTLIMDPDNDRFLKGQPLLVLKALTSADATLVTLPAPRAPGSTPTSAPWARPTRSCSTGSISH